MNKVCNPFKPFYNSDSEILILGTMPSVKSREVGFYYMHPKNRFWKILSIIYNEDIGESIEAKKDFLKKHKIALWDVLSSCEIKGSDDSSIKNIKVNDIKSILDKSNVKRIFTTGKKANQLYEKYIEPKIKIKAICLYSPSPANCKYSIEEIVENYQVINIKLK